MEKKHSILQNLYFVKYSYKRLNIFFIAPIIFLILFMGLNNQIIAQGVSINQTGVAPDGSAALDVSSSSQGMLLPRLTMAERDAIVSPVESLLIFNTTTQCFEAYNSNTSTWISFGCIDCTVPSSVIATASSKSIAEGGTLTLIGAATDATSWNWSGPNGFTSSSQSPVITNITAAGSGIYTLAASNSCGSVTDTTSCFICGGTLVITHIVGAVVPVTKTVNYGTVISSLSGESKCWITQNLGADNQATSADDATEASAGWYWQFNRKQGYKHDGTTITPAWTTTPIDTTCDWLAANDPCTIELGAGWRIPTKTEWLNADATGAWLTVNDTYASVLKLHAAGYLDSSNGSLFRDGTYGGLWSSTGSDATSCWGLDFNNSSWSGVSTGNKAYGFNLRCLRD